MYAHRTLHNVFCRLTLGKILHSDSLKLDDSCTDFQSSDSVLCAAQMTTAPSTFWSTGDDQACCLSIIPWPPTT